MGNGLIGTRIMRKNAILIASLLGESVEPHNNINISHLNLQKFLIIAPKNGSNTATMKYQRGGFPQNITFIRIVMCRREENICYIMINYEHKRRLSHRYLLLQNNGTVTIGTFMRILAPHLINQGMKGIPLVFSDAPSLIMTTPTVSPNYIINNDIEGNKSGVAIFNITTFGIYRTRAMQKNLQENIAIVKYHMK